MTGITVTETNVLSNLINLLSTKAIDSCQEIHE